VGQFEKGINNAAVADLELLFEYDAISSILSRILWTEQDAKEAIRREAAAYGYSQVFFSIWNGLLLRSNGHFEKRR